MKFEILNFSPAGGNFANFLVDWIGNQDSEFAETFHNPSLSGQETAV